MSESVSASPSAPGIIAFTEIPYTWKVPGEYMEVKPALNANAVMPFPARGLVMGQMFSTGVQGAPGAVYSNIANTAQAEALFGVGSIAAEMCEFLDPGEPLHAAGCDRHCRCGRKRRGDGRDRDRGHRDGRRHAGRLYRRRARAGGGEYRR